MGLRYAPAIKTALWSYSAGNLLNVEINILIISVLGLGVNLP